MSRPPVDVCLPDLDDVRTTENPDPPPVAELPRADPDHFELTAEDGSIEQAGRQGRLDW